MTNIDQINALNKKAFALNKQGVLLQLTCRSIKQMICSARSKNYYCINYQNMSESNC